MKTKQKTYTLTLGHDAAYYKTAFKKAGIQVSTYANEMLEKMTPSSGEIEVAFITPRELGFTTYPMTAKLFKKAIEDGYELCPAEVGPALRLAATDQPKGDWWYVGMEPISVSVGHPGVFDVDRDGDGEPWLDTYWSGPGREWDLDVEVVFRLRKSSDTSALEPLDLSTLTARVEALEAWQQKILEANQK